MADLSGLKAFDVANAAVTLWVFRKQTMQGAAPNFRGRWAELGDDFASALKKVAAQEIMQIEEVVEYGLLAQNNEGSVLTIPLIETHAEAVRSIASAEIPDKRVLKEKHSSNSSFYAVKLISGDVSLFGVRKTDASWRTKKKAGVVQFLFHDNTLVIDDKPSFNLSKHFDFFVFKEEIFVKEKRNFESILDYKTAHKDDFKVLCAEAEFCEAFIDLEELKKFVGENKIQLRRMSAVHQKGHYRNSIFMKNLRRDYAKAGLKINFDKDGKILPSQDTCRDILQALLDFRLLSIFSENVYDVPDTSVALASAPN